MYKRQEDEMGAGTGLHNLTLEEQKKKKFFYWHFPADFNRNVVPIFKKANQEEMSNYGPITLIYFSKVTEKATKQ